MKIEIKAMRKALPKTNTVSDYHVGKTYAVIQTSSDFKIATCTGLDAHYATLDFGIGTPWSINNNIIDHSEIRILNTKEYPEFAI